jgi:glycosyltransferase involved in cell wall biosynthesis
LSTGELIFVAMDVGGSGGMERHAERLIERLLDAGRAVTVVARTCALAPREGLRFVRVPVPRRPASLAYPAFFAAASVLVAGRGTALLHTTGAIVANRADVSTVHYCHRAAATRVNGSRASRPGPVYRLNSAVMGTLAQAGEAWCYRPARTRRLCAVSRGVAGELRGGFPAMAGAVLTIPNGVDSDLFRPDETARREVRSSLGITDEVPLALFVGGDWERKGLRHAVDALALARPWHLAVAGPGDAGPLTAHAASAGTGSRLRFLGPVRDMPRLYSAADAFVLPTAYEAFPLVSLEAAASGLSLLVTRVNGAEELVRHGHNGWFVGRDAGEIAQRLIELRADPSRARAMAQAARTAASRYTWDAMADRYMTLYADLSNGR